MYGEPHADFKAIGTVKDNTGKPIEGIQVAVKQHRHYENTPNVIYDQNDWFESDTVFTDSSGSYELTKSVFDAPHHVTVVFEDIDSTVNKHFNRISVGIDSFCVYIFIYITFSELF